MKKIEDALPGNFAFYHLGEVQLAPEAAQAPMAPIEDLWAAYFNILGDEPYTLLTIFENGLDTSTYIEMGNVLASKFADRLSHDSGQKVMISPPKALPIRRLGMLLSLLPAGSVFKNYIHMHGKNAVTFQALIIAGEPSDA